jgi:uncharacterized protein (DUF433 family)
MSAKIIKDRVAGSRITVWDVFLYLDAGWSAERIANELRLTCDQVQAAIDYIAENREEVEAGHRKIEARNARGNPPEIEEKRKQSRAKMQAWLEQRRAGKSTSLAGVQ